MLVIWTCLDSKASRARSVKEYNLAHDISFVCISCILCKLSFLLSAHDTGVTIFL